MRDRTPSTPSLLEPQSRGGEIAESGFSFQDHLILARIPLWLAQEGFTAMVKESIGDVEVKFFVPGYGFVKDLLEVKDHVLHPTEFWNEIRRFQAIAQGSPGTYRSFTLIGTGASKDLQPLLNGLDRVRGSEDFYESQEGVQQNSIRDYIALVKSRNATEQDAYFLLKKVRIETDWNTAKPYGEAVFKQAVADHLEEYGDLSVKTLDNIYNHLGIFVRQQRNRTISRQVLEQKLREKIPVQQQPSFRPISIYTAISPDDYLSHPGLRFDWAAFSGGDIRSTAPPEKWEQLLIELEDARTWIENHRNTKRIKLLGNRRLSACVALGSVFSAVRGYVIEMEYRSEVWATDAHPTAEIPEYPLVVQLIEGTGDRLVASISINRNVLPEVKAHLDKFNLSGMPLLDIQGTQAITSPEQANWVAGCLKKAIIQCLQMTNCSEIHLFYAGPAHLALYLGHRLDATAPIVCYGWSENRQYSQTCRLFSR